MRRWTETSEPHGPDLNPVWCCCGMCEDPIWAEEPQSMEPGYHAECYAEQAAAIETLLEDIRRTEEDNYDPNFDGIGLGILLTSPYDSPY